MCIDVDTYNNIAFDDGLYFINYPSFHCCFDNEGYSNRQSYGVGKGEDLSSVLTALDALYFCYEARSIFDNNCRARLAKNHFEVFPHHVSHVHGTFPFFTGMCDLGITDFMVCLSVYLGNG
jgi:hypothetical protein